MKLRALYLKHIKPLLMQSFQGLFKDVQEWFEANDIRLFADYVTAVGFAELYWPRSHTDADSWYTALVCIDLGNGLIEGGDFAFPTHGNVLLAQHGDVFFFNPSYYHCCTEPNPALQGSRLFISFYCKKETVNAAALTSALASRVGNAPLALCRMR